MTYWQYMIEPSLTPLIFIVSLVVMLVLWNVVVFGNQRLRRGGTTKALMQLDIWCLLLTLGVLLSMSKAIEVKKNYTDLHDTVNRLTYIHPEFRHEQQD